MSVGQDGCKALADTRAVEDGMQQSALAHQTYLQFVYLLHTGVQVFDGLYPVDSHGCHTDTNRSHRLFEQMYTP